KLDKLRALSDTLVKQQTHANRMENAANELAWHGWLESRAGNYGLAGKLCHEAENVSNDNEFVFDSCAKALGDAGEVAQAEELAAKKDRLLPEDTRNQKMCQPEFHSIIERERGNAVKAVDLLAPVAQYEQNSIDIPYERAQAYMAAGDHAK